MDSVLFRWVKRSTYDSIRVKDPATLYFIKDEHVFYKGIQEYGGVQSISYETDADGYYILSITNGDGTIEQLQVASKTNINNLRQAIDDLDQYLSAHVTTHATENVSAHVKLTDTIDESDLKDVDDNVAVTPKAVSVYVTNYQGKSFLKYPTFMDFPVTGKLDILYLALDTNFLWFYNNDHYELLGDNWKTIEQIQGIIS